MARLKTGSSRFKMVDRRIAVPKTKQVDAHYETPEHRAWAKAVVARAGGRCQWEGCTKAAPAHRMIADHIVEIKDGGAKLDLANGQCLCVQHNTLKGTQARAARMARRS